MYPNEVARFLNTETMPILDLQGRTGMTDYIDFLKPEELTHNIMKGVDCYRRSFLSFKVLDIKNNKKRVFTIFQRYTDDIFLWVNGSLGSFAVMEECFTDSVMNAENYNILEQIVNGKHHRYRNRR